MMITSWPETVQDTLLVKSAVLQDTIKSAPDTTAAVLSDAQKSIAVNDTLMTKKDSATLITPLKLKEPVSGKTLTQPIEAKRIVLTDTTSVCQRNSIIDITFHDSTAIANISFTGIPNQVPFTFAENFRKREAELRSITIKNLKPGIEVPSHPLQEDWIIIIILVVVFLYSLVGASSRNILQRTIKFFLLRGINDNTSRESGGFFNWQSTIKNFVSFLIIGLFTYSSASILNLIPSEIRGFSFWVIALGVVIIAVTLRHIVCIIVGEGSGEKEVFREYLMGIYQSYRLSAFLLFILVIMMSYSDLFAVKVYCISGIIVLAAIYLVRIIRLMIIFLNRNISLFYLILYLCALEILPVLISVKYFTGLV